MHKITKEFLFDAAHRLIDYSGPCANLHGHTYTAIINFAAQELDYQGFVIDYNEIKLHIKSWVDQYWDHGVLLNSKDKLVSAVSQLTSKIYIFKDTNPTAENIAKELFVISLHQINTQKRNCQLESVAIKETPTSFAIYRP
jgi:6-pyruvoyltetrahydropterin/6-carboxytetrahydropterin synthase